MTASKTRLALTAVLALALAACGDKEEGTAASLSGEPIA